MSRTDKFLNRQRDSFAQQSRDESPRLTSDYALTDGFIVDEWFSTARRVRSAKRPGLSLAARLRKKEREPILKAREERAMKDNPNFGTF